MMNSLIEKLRLRKDVVHVIGRVIIKRDEEQSPDFYAQQALSMCAQGAELIELGVENGSSMSFEIEADLILPVLRLIVSKDICTGVCTSNPEIMRLSYENGAQFIVDEKALSEKGSAEVLAACGLPVLLCCPGIIKHSDPVSSMQEFFYERIDHCLNASMKRKQILLDPFAGNCNRADRSLKLLGRISAMASFGLPLCMTIPKSLPFDAQKEHNLSAVAGLTAALFGVSKGISFVRTETVRDLSLALATWQLAACTARPHQLSNGIIGRFVSMRNAFRSRRQKN